MAFCRQKLGTRSTAEHKSRLNFEEGEALYGGFCLLPALARLWAQGREFSAVTPEGREAAASFITQLSLPEAVEQTQLQNWGWEHPGQLTSEVLGPIFLLGLAEGTQHLVGWTGRQKRARDSVWLGKSTVPETQLCSSPIIHCPSIASSSWALLLVIYLYELQWHPQFQNIHN